MKHVPSKKENIIMGRGMFWHGDFQFNDKVIFGIKSFITGNYYGHGDFQFNDKVIFGIKSFITGNYYLKS